MRKILCSIAERLLIKFSKKGELEMMAMLFACRVVEGRTEFARVPAKLKPQVAEIIINDFALPEIVPTEFGGSAEA
jgi:hypothetical protein